MTITKVMNLKESNSTSETIKLAAGLAVAFAADIAITTLLKQHIPIGHGFMKLMTKLGIFAIGMKVGEDVEEYFHKVWDDTAEAAKEAKKEAEKAVIEIANEAKDEGGH